MLVENPKGLQLVSVRELEIVIVCLAKESKPFGLKQNRMSQITHNVVLGDMGNASSDIFFRAWKITHILNCAEEHRTHKYPVDLPVVAIPLEDDSHPAAESLILTAAGKLEEWTKEGGSVFVHCKAGVSRSPTVVMAWLMVYKDFSFDDAWCKVVKCRTCVYPNPFFIKLLKNLHANSKP